MENVSKSVKSTDLTISIYIKTANHFPPLMNDHSTPLLMAITFMLLLVLINVNVTTISINAYGSSTSNQEWLDSFNLDDCDLSSSGANNYLILEPGHQLILEGQEDGEQLQLTITVLNETKIVNGTEAGIVEERESEDGELVEVSRNWFVVCRPTNDIFYLGEDVDVYEDGEVVNHEGAWEAGVNDARLGLIMPGKAELGLKYYQEVAPGVAEDRAEIIGLDKVLETPAGKFEQVLETEETNALEPDEKESKFYAPGIGLIQEETLKLIKYGNVTSK